MNAPSLPNEIIDEIVSAFWYLPPTPSRPGAYFVSPKDRAAFISQTSTVSPVWRASILRVCSKDLYIPSSHSALKLVEALNSAVPTPALDTVSESSSSAESNATRSVPGLSPGLTSLLQIHCSSITFHYDDNPAHIVVVDLEDTLTSLSSTNLSARLILLANKITHHSAQLLSRIEETQLQRQVNDLKREKWKRVLHASGLDDTRKALGLPVVSDDSSYLQRVVNTFCGLKPRKITVGPDMEDELRDRLGELVAKKRLSEDDELEKVYVEKWLWVIGEEERSC
ncbi:hypothetical protein D9758_015576 [Tetrapyrgos nigripes]|uniref:Uncharacterized protein n=1 Tax=Tetrapyrgos nigripes TaxID=182062 RepID=A0A8H5CBN8_9AGAR|nr:hypothetical protein D9758_015576 [Tetrapyrgos nigripes]